jgi:uncharacterized protein with FMN-binding domain
VSADPSRRHDVTPRQDDTESGRASRWVKSNLVALGSAAVLAVYSAGYARTRTAAAQFAEEPRGRRAPERATTQAATPSPAAQAEAIVPKAAAVVDSTPTKSAPAEKPVVAKAPTATKPESVTKQAVVADTAPAQAPAKVDVAPPAAVAPVVTPPTAPAPATPPADSSAKSADTAHVQLKDGVFSGWGTSRHGDIEAAVEIKNGKIVSAFIVQCLTRYSCSWISALPPQVPARQSAEVDYVSGATQSSNAFYYAIVEALSKAK